MRNQKCILIGFLIAITWSCFLTGCVVWPVMSEGLGYHPRDMGKSDQVLWPWATRPTVLAEHQGESVRGIFVDQILNPQASENTSAVEHFDGKAANLAMDRYRKFFAKPPFAKQQASSTAGS